MTKSTTNLIPYPDKLNSFEKIQLYLFEEVDKIPFYHKLTKTELRLKTHYSKIFSYWIDKPTLSDRKIFNFIKTEIGVADSAAHKYMNDVKLLLGNVRNASKQWQRYKVIAMLDRAYEIAERKKDAKAIILAADRLGKYTQLDKEDTLKIPYDEIVPQNWIISDDVQILGLEPIPDLAAKQKEMRIKYGSTAIEDIDVINEEK